MNEAFEQELSERIKDVSENAFNGFSSNDVFCVILALIVGGALMLMGAITL